jgi:hypothetical protein
VLAQISSAGTIYGVRRATRADVGPIVASDQIGAPRDGTEDLGSYDAAFDAIDADPAQLLVVASDDGGAVVATMQLTFIPGSTASTAGSVSAGRTTASS